jgi:hypothetical protein
LKKAVKFGVEYKEFTKEKNSSFFFGKALLGHLKAHTRLASNGERGLQPNLSGSYARAV